jgi:hypothetical protein
MLELDVASLVLLCLAKNEITEWSESVRQLHLLGHLWSSSGCSSPTTLSLAKDALTSTLKSIYQLKVLGHARATFGSSPSRSPGRERAKINLA